MNKKISCCFCGKEIDFLNSHDPRPIVSKYGCRCCLECNNNIVCPTREEVWSWEPKARWFDEFVNKYQITDFTNGEYSSNPIIEYCMQVEDFRECDQYVIKQLMKEVKKTRRKK